MVLISFDLSKLSHVVKNDVVKKTGYDELAKNVHAIDTSGFVKQTEYDCKINETKGQISNVNGLATTATLNDVKKKIPNVSSQKTDYDAKVKDVGGKYFTTPDYNKFMNEILEEKIKNKILVYEADISDIKISNKSRIKSQTG